MTIPSPMKYFTNDSYIEEGVSSINNTIVPKDNPPIILSRNKFPEEI